MPVHGPRSRAVALILALAALVAVAPAMDERAAAAPVARGASASCTNHSTSSGSILVCPGSAPVGALVNVRGDLRCGSTSGTGRGLTAVFLGPKDRVGAGGGGQTLHFRVETNSFQITFRIPASLPAPSRGGRRVTPVTVGSGYAFATYPAGSCTVPFRITAPHVSHARVWRTPGVRGLVCGVQAARGSKPAQALVCETTGVRPKHGPTCCEFGLVLARRGRAHVLWSRDWPFADPKPSDTVVLPAGPHWHRFGITCRLASARVNCANASGHGFEFRSHSARSF